MGPGPTTAAPTPAASSPHAELPLHTLIPRLELNGSNWAAFQMTFSEAMDTADRWGHFDGTEPHPGTANTKAPTTKELATQRCWDHEDKIGHNLLLQRLHDTTAMCLKPLSTARERWTWLSQEYQAKSVYAQTDLQQAFFDMRCAKDGDVWAFLQALGVTATTTDPIVRW
jgi:gag-polypeptide of LTR copia-type